MVREKQKRFLLQWHITAHCDQACKHCYMMNTAQYKEELKNTLTFEECKKVIEKIKSHSNNYESPVVVGLSGGDPLLHPHFFDILATLKNDNIKLYILGNPFHIDEGVAKRLVEMGVHSYQMSIDGLPRLHDHYRRKGSFDHTLKSFKILKEAGITTVAMLTLTSENKDQLEDLVELLKKTESIDAFSMTRLVPIGNGEKLKDLMLSPLEFKNTLHKWTLMKQKLIQEKTPMHLHIKEGMFWPLLAHDLNLIDENNKEYFSKFSCALYRDNVDMLAILADGTIYPCRRLPISLGNIKEIDFEEVYKNPIWDNFQHKAHHRDCYKCAVSTFCVGCIAVKYALNNNFIEQDPQCWNIFD